MPAGPQRGASAVPLLLRFSASVTSAAYHESGRNKPRTGAQRVSVIRFWRDRINATIGLEEPAMPVIGFLNDLSPDQWQSVLPGFRRALGEAGFVEGRNVTFAYRWTEGQRDRLPELAGDLARADGDLIVVKTETTIVSGALVGTKAPF